MSKLQKKWQSCKENIEKKDKDKNKKKEQKEINNERVEDDEIVYENLNTANLLLKNYRKTLLNPP